MLSGGVAERSVAEFGQQALAAEHLDLPAVPPRYRSSYFAHIFGGGYARRDTTPVDANVGG